MNTAEISERIAKASPRFMARIAGALFLLSILAGVSAVFFIRGRLGFAVELFAASCYIVVTLLFYGLFKPVNRSLSMLAAFFNLVVCTVGALGWHPHGVDVGLIFFGGYCLLLGYLIFRATFLPRILGVLMAIAGLAWLTFLLPSLANFLSPYNLATGCLGQGSLTLWLLVKGVNDQRWKAQASAAGDWRSSRAIPLDSSFAHKEKPL